MKKKLIVFSSVGMSLPHLGLELEVIDSLKSNYSNLELVTCNMNLPSCYLNPTHNLIACSACQTRTTAELQKRFDFRQVHQLPKVNNIKIELSAHHLSSQDNLMELSYKGIDYGRGIVSSLISIYRNTNIDLNPLKELIETWASWCIIFIDFLPTLLSKDCEVLIFNGRFFEIYPIKAFCEFENITFYTHEKGSNFTKYQLIKNNTVHSLKVRDRQMRQLWDKAPKNKINIATKWFEDKRASKITTEKDFTKDQEKGNLPKDFNPNLHNVAIFNSSEDEFKMIKEWNHDLYTSQNELIQRLALATLDKTEIHYTLRFHPNLANVGDHLYEEIKSFNLPNLTIVGPNEKIDSYALLVNCNKVLTFGSRMSIEAAHSNIPSIIYGKSFYNKLDSLYTPNTFSDLVNLITNKPLLPKESKDYLMAAYFLLERGNKCKKLVVKDKNYVIFEKHKLKTNLIISGWYFLKNFNKINLWKANLKFFNRGSLLKNLKKL